MGAPVEAGRKGLFYGWYIVLAGAGTNLLLTGFIIFGMGVFIGRFREEFGWSMAAIAARFSIRSLESGLLSPLVGGIEDKLRFVVGWMGDKLGRRQVYTFSFICHGLGIIAFVFVSPALRAPAPQSQAAGR